MPIPGFAHNLNSACYLAHTRTDRPTSYGGSFSVVPYPRQIRLYERKKKEKVRNTRRQSSDTEEYQKKHAGGETGYTHSLSPGRPPNNTLNTRQQRTQVHTQGHITHALEYTLRTLRLKFLLHRHSCYMCPLYNVSIQVYDAHHQTDERDHFSRPEHGSSAARHK